MNRKLKILMILSVMLNVLLGGLVLGQVLHHMGVGVAEKDAKEKVLLARLPVERQQEYKALVKEMQETRKAMRDRMRDTKRRNNELLSAPVFDAAAYQESWSTFDRLNTEQKQKTLTAIADLAQKWSPEERKLLGKLLEERYSRYRDKRPEDGKAAQ